MANLARLVSAAIAASAALAIVTVGSGCTTEVAPEDEGTSSQAQTTNQCAAYPRNPACDAKLFLVKAVELANEDPKGNLLDPIQDAKTCIGNLIKAGGVVVGTGGLGALVVVSMATAVKGIETFYACKGLAEYLGKLGIAENVSCFFEPVLNDKSVQLCECTSMCNRGVDREGADGQLRTVKLKFGYLDRIGSARCYCTNDPKEVRCQWSCNKWASTSSTDCTCAD